MPGKRRRRRRWARSVFVIFIAGFAGIAVYIYWMNRTADWLPVYEELRAAGQCDRAASLLTAAYLQSDPRAADIQADWYEQGLCGTTVDRAQAQQTREWGHQLSASAAPYPGFWNRQLERLSGLLNRRRFRTQGVGSAFEWRDTYLWAACVERFRMWLPDPHKIRLAVAQARGKPIKRPTRSERAKASCADKSLVFANALDQGAYGDQARAEADDWYMHAALLGSDDAQLTLDLGRLEGRFPLFFLHEEDAQTPEGRAEARRAVIEDIFSLVFLGYGPAALVAAKLALAGDANFIFEGSTDAARDEAIYYYVLIAQYRGEDVSDIMAQATSRLTEAQRAQVKGRRDDAVSVLE